MLDQSCSRKQSNSLLVVLLREQFLVGHSIDQLLLLFVLPHVAQADKSKANRSKSEQTHSDSEGHLVARSVLAFEELRADDACNV